MKRTTRKGVPQGRYAVEYREGTGSYAHVRPVMDTPERGTLFRLALGRPLSRPKEQPVGSLPAVVRKALTEDLPPPVTDALELALSAPILRRPRDLPAERRMLAAKYKALAGHLGKAQRILLADDLFPDFDMSTALAVIGHLLTKGEERRASLKDLSISEDFRNWEILRRRRVAGTVLSTLEAAGVPTGGPRAARVMNVVMDHFFGRTVDDSKRALARHRRWWKGLTTGDRDALLSRVRSGVPAK